MLADSKLRTQRSLFSCGHLPSCSIVTVTCSGLPMIRRSIARRLWYSATSIGRALEPSISFSTCKAALPSSRQNNVSSIRRKKRRMEDLNITSLRVVPCKDSKFIKVSRVEFNQLTWLGTWTIFPVPLIFDISIVGIMAAQSGVDRVWDYVRIHNGVGVMLFNTTRQAFILVKQFRPAVFMYRNDDANEKERSVVTGDDETVPIKAPVSAGVTHELCAGIVDASKSLDRIAQQEVLEETGYQVPLENFQRVLSWFGNVGITGNEFTLFYANVTDEMNVSTGGGNLHEGERIELRYLPLSEVKQFVFDESVPKPAGLISAFMWYMWKNKIY